MTDHVVRVLRLVAAALLVVGASPSAWSARAAAAETAPQGTSAPAAAESPGRAAVSPGAKASPSAAQEQCEASVAILVGKGSDALRDPDVQALANRMPMLAACGAVVRDSDEPCDLLTDDDASSCRKTRLRFHELRDPKNRGFVFSDTEYRECTASLDASVCDAIRAAMSTRDPKKCPAQQPYGAVCRATIKLDPTLCPKEGADECKRDIQRWKGFANGLPGLKKSGSPADRALAAAALGEPNPCKPMAEAALAGCGPAAAPSGKGKVGATPAATPQPH